MWLTSALRGPSDHTKSMPSIVHTAGSLRFQHLQMPFLPLLVQNAKLNHLSLHHLLIYYYNNHMRLTSLSFLRYTFSYSLSFIYQWVFSPFNSYSIFLYSRAQRRLHHQSTRQRLRCLKQRPLPRKPNIFSAFFLTTATTLHFYSHSWSNIIPTHLNSGPCKI